MVQRHDEVEVSMERHANCSQGSSLCRLLQVD